VKVFYTSQPGRRGVGFGGSRSLPQLGVPRDKCRDDTYVLKWPGEWRRLIARCVMTSARVLGALRFGDRARCKRKAPAAAGLYDVNICFISSRSFIRLLVDELAPQVCRRR
jgi:hypothetical protein